MRWRLLALWVGLLSSAAALALPDLARGRAALQRGDLAAAEKDLAPLAEQGYLEAQVGLARVYAAQDTPESAAQAARWYRLAAAQDPSQRIGLARSLMRSGKADPAEVDALLKALVAERDAAAPALQLRLYREVPSLAKPGEAALLAQALAASRDAQARSEAISWYRDNRLQDEAYEAALGALCERDRARIQECYADLARHFRLRKDAGALRKVQAEVLERDEAGQMSDDSLERVARYLSADDLPGEPMVDLAHALLVRIEAPSAQVMARRARLLLEYPALDSNSDPEALLQQAHAQGSAEAALQLGRLYLDEFHPHADPLKAQALLKEAAQTLPAAHTWLGRLYERGYLGLPQPELALQHYLIAARAGNSNADFALARMYSTNRGVQVDAVQALAFARLAEQQGHPGAGELIQGLMTRSGPDQLDLGLQLAQREWAARSAQAATGDAQIATAPKENP